MKRLMTAVAFVAATIGATALPAAAQPYQAFVSTDLNLRSGPGVEYPPVLVLPAGTPVIVHGCLEAWSWCDVSWGDARGWVAGSYLAYDQLGQRVPVVQVAPTIGLPIVTFSLGSYWDNHYRARPWYRERARWENHYQRYPNVVHVRPPGYRDGYRDGRPPTVYHRPPRFDNDRRPDYVHRDRDRRPDYRPDRRPDVRHPDYRSDRGPRPDNRVDNRRNDRPNDGGRPRGVSGGQTERDANRFNRQRTGPMPGE